MVFIEVNTVTVALVSVATLVVGWLYWRSRDAKRRYNLPPGPTGWPLVGMLFKISRQPHKQFMEFAEKFGKTFSMRVGTQRVVVLNGYQAVKEALVDKALVFSGRPEYWIFRRMKDGGGLGTRTYDRVWKKHRTFMLTHFRNFGVGKRSLEEKILEEAEVLCQALDATKGKAVDCHHELQCAVTNVMCNILFGNRWEYEDSKFRKLLDVTAEFVSKLNHNLFANYLPFLWHVPCGSVKYLKTAYAKQNEFITQRILERKDDADIDDPKDFTEALLSESSRKQNQGLPSIFDELEESDMDTITHLVSEFFRAGADTTNTTLRWTLMFMVSHPEVQKQVHEEIDEVLGRNRPATIKDRDDMPLTQAAVWEAMRMMAPAPLALPHTTTKDAKLGDFDVPAGTYVLPNIHSVHMDPTCWENPQKYDPTRFIDPNGKLGVRDAFMPFGTGHRKCAGEQLARMELFLFFAYIMQRFRFELAEGSPPLRWEGTLGITYTPDPFSIRCIPR